MKERNEAETFPNGKC